MTEFNPEQWAHQRVVRRGPATASGGRIKFLDDKCPADSVTRTEVERLLTAAEKSGLLDSPPFQIPIRRPHARAIPESISRYRIIEKLGEGGMGVVYRGQDEALKRQVAIKVLLPEDTADPDRKRRLVREAQAASALNHPNIVTVYDVGTDQGADFIAMEYVSGATLGKCIGRKGLKLATCLKYAIQIADALAAAHAAGIIHRDLKPGNIMVTDKDLIKILDFGLAKTIRLPGRSTGETNPGSSQGAIAGTAAYMSPEQAEGKKVDERSDIFSFGSVFYEMLTGRRAFQGQSDMSTLSSVLTQEPVPLSEIKASLPREIARIIAMCLRKEPTRRLQHMDDVKLAVEAVKEEMDSGLLFLPPPPLPFPRWKRVAFALVLLLAAALASSPWWWTRIWPPPPVQEPVLTQLTADAGLSAYPALSRDGRLAFASDRSSEDNLDIWVQHVSGGEPMRVTKHEADDYDPDFSPDGSKIAFRSDRDGGGIYLVSSLGGEAQLIALRGRNPHFSPDGKWLLYWEGAEGAGLIANSGRSYVISANGGAAQAVRPEFASSFYPMWANEGKEVLFLGRLEPHAAQDQTVDWWMAPLQSGQAEKTGARKLFGTQNLSPPIGHNFIIPAAWDRHSNSILFAARLGDSTNLWEVPLSAKTRKVTGPARRRTFGTGSEDQVSLAPAPEPGGRHRMCYSSLTLNVDIWKLNLDANKGVVKGNLEPLTKALSLGSYPSVSDDGTKLAFRSSRSGKWTIRTRDLKTGRESVLVESNFPFLQPKISRDGKSVAYWDRIDGKSEVYWIGFRGGPAEKLCENCGSLTDVSPDGLKLLFEASSPPHDVMMLDTVSRQTANLVHSLNPDYILYGGRYSPDGRWVAFHAAVDRSANRKIFIAPIRDGRGPGESEWISITDGSQVERDACWSPDGSLLYFISERDGFRCIWAQRLQRVTKHPAGPPFAIQHFHHARHLLTRLGSRSPATGMSVTRDKLVLAFGELTGNIWLSELPAKP